MTLPPAASTTVVDITMPRLSDSMEEGTILKWLKAAGDLVARGDELVEIETDKATMTYEADGNGFLAIIGGEGDTLPVGAVIARLLPDAAELGSESPAAPPDVGGEDGRPRVFASPLARRVAQELGVDLAGITGSGPGGRVVRADVEAARPPRPMSAPPAPPAPPASVAAPTAAPEHAGGGAKGEATVQTPSRTQALIARRMAEAKATVPDFTVTIEVDAEAALSLREELRGAVTPLPSLNDVVIMACARALRDHPRVNGSFRDGAFEQYSRVNVGMAVASEEALVVPTLFDADRKRLTEIARETRTLAGKVRDGSVTASELAGGTFTVSNLGMFGVTRFTAVINPPQAAILAVGAATARAVVGEDGGLVARRVMELTLTADHRLLYGADAAGFLNSVRGLLEHPAVLLS
jgi:pyruvate dehydrogenase E2 component (dihydrolipoamide acetyltransferase)